MTTFLKFKPIYQERVWGGRALASFLGRKLSGTAPIGESWEIVDRPEAQSVGAEGVFAGRTLREMIATGAAEIMGPGWPAAKPFPILVKWLDCRDRLSVQVHPPAAIAASLNGEPKTENWYFAQTDPGAAVYAGLKAGVTQEEFARAIDAGTVDRCLDRLLVQRGDSLLIRSGTMHAIDAGNVILEIQQNSDTTYRVYDWGRMGLDGKPRALHLRESLASLAANTSPAPHLLREGQAAVLVQCPEFSLRRVQVAAGGELHLAAGQQPRILSVVEGALAGGSGVGLGDNVLVPYAAEVTLTASTAATVLVTEDFFRP